MNGRFNEVKRGFNEVGGRFAEMNGRFDTLHQASCELGGEVILQANDIISAQQTAMRAVMRLNDPAASARRRARIVGAAPWAGRSGRHRREELLDIADRRYAANWIECHSWGTLRGARCPL